MTPHSKAQIVIYRGTSTYQLYRWSDEHRDSGVMLGEYRTYAEARKSAQIEITKNGGTLKDG